MAIEIELTPRKLERIVFIIIILFFMSTTVYYSYKYSKCTGTEDNITGDVVSVEKTKVEEVVKEEPKTEVKEETTKKSELSGTIDITIAPIRYEIKESASFRKAVIDTLSFIIKNGATTDLTMKVNIYHSNSETSEEYNNNPRVTLEFDTIKPGESRTKSFRDIQGLNLYNLDLGQTLKFVFEDGNDKEIKTLTKILKIE